MKIFNLEFYSLTIFTWEPETFVLITTDDPGEVDNMPEGDAYGRSSWDDVDGRTDRSEDEIVSIPLTWDGDTTLRFGWGSRKFSWITGAARGTGLRRGEVTNFSLFPWLEYNTVFTRILEDPATKYMHIVNFKLNHFCIAKATKKLKKIYQSTLDQLLTTQFACIVKKGKIKINIQ